MEFAIAGLQASSGGNGDTLLNPQTIPSPFPSLTSPKITVSVYLTPELTPHVKKYRFP